MIARQSTIQHHTFEALLPLTDGATHWFPPSHQIAGLCDRGFLSGDAERGYIMTARGRDVVAAYAARHQLALPREA